MGAHRGREVMGRIDGRRSGSSCCRALNKLGSRRLWRRWRALRARRKSDRRRHRLGMEIPRRGRFRDRERQRSREVGQALSAEGRRGSAAAAASAPKQRARSELHPPAWPKLPRRKTAVLRDGNPRREPLDPTREADRSRRCHSTPQAFERAARPRPKGRWETEREPEAPGEPCGTIL